MEKLFKNIRNKMNLSLIILLLSFILIGCNSKEEIILSDKLVFEINSEIKLSSLIKTSEEVEIISDDEKIDTSKLGEKEITIKYYNKRKEEKDFSFKINIIDTTKPTIECEEIININVGSEVNLLSNVKINDNSGENIIPTIKGEYNYNEVGEYNLKYVAIDISGNVNEKEFILKVNPLNIKKTGFYVYKTANTWHEIQFNEDNKIAYLPWFCPGNGCGGYSMEGTYAINNNKINVTLTHEITDMGDYIKLNNPKKWEFTIINENQIEMDGNKYTWQKNYDE